MGKTILRSRTAGNGYCGFPARSCWNHVAKSSEAYWRSGVKNIYVNDLTPLSNSARKIAGQKICYGDIVIVNPIIMKAVIIELQGEVIHGSGAVLDHDAARMTALQSMGYDVFLVTHDMLNDHDQLDAIIHSVCERLELRYKPKTEAMRCAETRLRANVLCNWLGIGK